MVPLNLYVQHEYTFFADECFGIYFSRVNIFECHVCSFSKLKNMVFTYIHTNMLCKTFIILLIYVKKIQFVYIIWVHILRKYDEVLIWYFTGILNKFNIYIDCVEAHIPTKRIFSSTSMRKYFFNHLKDTSEIYTASFLNNIIN